MDVLLLTDTTDFESALPSLESFAHSVRRAGLGDPTATAAPYADSDVAIVDARTDLVAAGRLCRRLTASAPALAVVGVVLPGDFAAVDFNWHFDDVLLAAATEAEVQARLRLAITRRRGAVAGTLRFGDLVLRPASYTASLDGTDLSLTLTEFKLLSFLVQHADRAFNRTRLMREVWGHDGTDRVRTVDVHVRRLRAKLGVAHESMIDTVRGVGYMAVTPPQPRRIVSAPLPGPDWEVATADSESIAR